MQWLLAALALDVARQDTSTPLFAVRAAHAEEQAYGIDFDGSFAQLEAAGQNRTLSIPEDVQTLLGQLRPLLDIEEVETTLNQEDKFWEDLFSKKFHKPHQGRSEMVDILMELATGIWIENKNGVLVQSSDTVRERAAVRLGKLFSMFPKMFDKKFSKVEQLGATKEKVAVLREIGCQMADRYRSKVNHEVDEPLGRVVQQLVILLGGDSGSVMFEPSEFKFHLMLQKGTVTTIKDLTTGKDDLTQIEFGENFYGENFILKRTEFIISWTTAEGEDIWLEDGSPAFEGDDPIKLELGGVLVRDASTSQHVRDVVSGAANALPLVVTGGKTAVDGVYQSNDVVQVAFDCLVKHRNLIWRSFIKHYGEPAFNKFDQIPGYFEQQQQQQQQQP